MRLFWTPTSPVQALFVVRDSLSPSAVPPFVNWMLEITRGADTGPTTLIVSGQMRAEQLL